MNKPQKDNLTSPAAAHPLDNVVWHALTTRQAAFSLGTGDARRFLPEVGPLAAFSEPGDKGFDSLAALAGPGGVLAIFLPAPYEPRAGWRVVGGAPLLQMVWENMTLEQGGGKTAPALSSPVPVKLGSADSADMVALATLTRPGPFGPRTQELGNFFGVRRDGRLAAMAGERMKVPGYTEVSAVCTHPEHTGHGYAAALMSQVMQGIRERGETPFLHVKADNLRAIGLYKRLGFRERAAGHFVVLARE